MRNVLAILTCLIAFSCTTKAADRDQQIDKYFSVWADNAMISSATVDRLYAHRVNYYGQSMTTNQVYQDKLNYIRQWPTRKYQVIPGSVSNTCTAAQTSCLVTAILSWKRVDRSGYQGRQGANTIALTLVRENGVLKIARESGTKVAYSDCGATVAGPWRCSAYR